MRKSRNGQRRAFAAFTKFSVLLMCFATVFALVLTAGVFDIGGGFGRVRFTRIFMESGRHDKSDDG